MSVLIAINNEAVHIILFDIVMLNIFLGIKLTIY